MNKEAHPGEAEKKTIRSDHPSLDMNIAQFAQSARELKEDLRFIIGLATGALIFSVAFIQQVAPAPKFTWLLLVGWSALLISILAGIEICRRAKVIVDAATNIQGWTTVLSEHPGLLLYSADRTMLVMFMDFLFEKGEVDKERLGTMRQFYHKLKKKDLGKIYDVVTQTIGGFGKEERTLAEGVLGEVMKLGNAFDKLSKGMGMQGTIKSLRLGILFVYYTNFVAYYTFYLGIVFLSLFGIANLFF